jgi:hypothetical protein
VVLQSWTLQSGGKCGHHQASVGEEVSNQTKKTGAVTYTEHGVIFLWTLAMLKLNIGLNLGGACEESTLKNAESDEETEVLCPVFSNIESSMLDVCGSSGSEPMIES